MTTIELVQRELDWADTQGDGRPSNESLAKMILAAIKNGAQQ